MHTKRKLLPLSDLQLMILGELVALHGFIGEELSKSVLYINVAHGNQGKLDIIRHKSFQDDVDAWAKFAHDKLVLRQLLPTVDSIAASLKGNIADRNDFVHSVFMEHLEDGFVAGPYSMGSFGSPVAVRQGVSRAPKALNDLPSVRDEAEKLANALVDLNYAIIRPHLPPLFKTDN